MSSSFFCRAVPVAAAVAFVAASASARPQHFSFIYSDAGLSAHGELFADVMGGGLFATSGSITVDSGGPPTGTFDLLPNTSAPGQSFFPIPGSGFDYFQYDDQVFTAGNPYLDVYGLVFTNDPSNSTAINIWGNGANSPYSGYSWTDGTSGFVHSSDGGTFSLMEVVPLPAEATMAGVGLVGLVGVRGVRRRRA